MQLAVPPLDGIEKRRKHACLPVCLLQLTRCCVWREHLAMGHGGAMQLSQSPQLATLTLMTAQLPPWEVRGISTRIRQKQVISPPEIPSNQREDTWDPVFISLTPFLFWFVYLFLLNVLECHWSVKLHRFPFNSFSYSPLSFTAILSYLSQRSGRFLQRKEQTPHTDSPLSRFPSSPWLSNSGSNSPTREQVVKLGQFAFV